MNKSDFSYNETSIRLRRTKDDENRKRDSRDGCPTTNGDFVINLRRAQPSRRTGVSPVKRGFSGEIEDLLSLCESRIKDNHTKYFVLRTVLQSLMDEYEDQGITPERHTLHQSLRTDITALLESDETDQTVKANVLIKHFLAGRG